MRIKNWSKFQHFKDRRPPWIKLYRDLLDDVQWFKLSPEAAKALVMIWLVASESGGALPATKDLAWRLRISTDDMEDILAELGDAEFLVDGDEEEEPEDDLTPSQKLAKKNGFGSRYIPDEIKRAVQARDKGACQHCGAEETLEYDHITPVSSGGESTLDNVQLLCRPCNRRKRTKNNELSKAQLGGCAKRSPETETETETEKKDTPDGFDQFWDLYKRKEAKGRAVKALKTATRTTPIETILDGLRRFKWPDDPKYYPLPATWLNDRRWEDCAAQVAATATPPPDEVRRAREERIAWALKHGIINNLDATPAEISALVSAGRVTEDQARKAGWAA